MVTLLRTERGWEMIFFKKIYGVYVFHFFFLDSFCRFLLFFFLDVFLYCVNYKLALTKNLAMQKDMETHSSTLAWKIPWTEEPGSLQSIGSQRVGHNWATSLTHSLTQEPCQQMNNKGICHLPLLRLNPMLLQLLTFNKPWGSSWWSEVLCAPGNLVGQVFR